MSIGIVLLFYFVLPNFIVHNAHYLTHPFAITIPSLHFSQLAVSQLILSNNNLYHNNQYSH